MRDEIKALLVAMFSGTLSAHGKLRLAVIERDHPELFEDVLREGFDAPPITVGGMTISGHKVRFFRNGSIALL